MELLQTRSQDRCISKRKLMYHRCRKTKMVKPYSLHLMPTLNLSITLNTGPDHKPKCRQVFFIGHYCCVGQLKSFVCIHVSADFFSFDSLGQYKILKLTWKYFAGQYNPIEIRKEGKKKNLLNLQTSAACANKSWVIKVSYVNGKKWLMFLWWFFFGLQYWPTEIDHLYSP